MPKTSRILSTDTVLDDPTTTGFVELPMHRILKAPWNYKEDHDKKQRQLANKIRRNGAIVNLVVRVLTDQEHDDGGPLFETCDGNHRYDALLECDYEQTLVYNVGDVSQAQAERLAIELNEGDFDADPVLLAQSLDRVMDEFGMEDFLKTSPFDESEIEMYQELHSFDWDEFDDFDDPGDDEHGDNTEDDGFERFEVAIPEDEYSTYEKCRDHVTEHLLDTEGETIPSTDTELDGAVIMRMAREFERAVLNGHENGTV